MRNNLQPDGLNHFYRVIDPVVAYVLVGHEPTNEYYGAARVHVPVYQRVTLDVGAIVAAVAGGIYVAQDGRHAVAARIMPYREWNHAANQVWPLASLQEVPRVTLDYSDRAGRRFAPRG